MKITFIDLFCGIGGFRLALESLGAKCVFSCDKDRQARKTYQANFGEEPEGDITTIAADSIPDFNILCGGFPCQPFSIAGKQRGFKDTRGTLFFEIVRIVKAKQPEVVFLENVPNLARHDNGNTLRVILDTLDGLGYNVHYQVLNAAHYGVAQIRKRIYFVCFRKDLSAEFSFPEPTFEDVAVEDFLLPAVDEKYYLDNRLFTIYKPDTVIRQLDTYRMGYVGKPSQGKRLYSVKGCTPTFVVSARGPCGSTEAYYINGRIRRLTPYEAKRILGFPDDFVFPVKEDRIYQQLGNSVAVPVVRMIAEKIMETGIFNMPRETGSCESPRKDAL